MANFYDVELGYTLRAAWGLRKLISSYSGPIVRVRNIVSDVETDLYADVDGEITPNAAWQTEFAKTVVNESIDRSGYTLRLRIPLGSADMPHRGNRGKFRIASGATSGLVVSKVTVCQLDVAGGSLAVTPLDNFIPVKFGGNAGFSIGANSYAETDEFEMPAISNVRAIGINILVTSGKFGGCDHPVNGAKGWKNGDFTESASGSGWDTTGTIDSPITRFDLLALDAITTVYDQTGGGAHLVQTTPQNQPLLAPSQSGSGQPAAVFDGEDDSLYETSAGTTRPYMVASPVHISLHGAKLPRREYGRVWCIPHSDGSDPSPYFRIGIEQGLADNLLFTGEVRVDGTATAVNLFGVNNREGYSAHAVVPALGKFLQAGGVPEQTITTDTTITYPNVTRMVIGSGGNRATNNNGMYWFEHVVYETASPVAADIQTFIDKLAYHILFGQNRYYRLTVTGAFNSDEDNGGFAEMQARAVAAGPDLTTKFTPFVANKRESSSESWERAVDNDPGTHWGPGGANFQPQAYFALSTNTLINEIFLKARNSFSQFTAKKYILARFTATGWQSATEVDNTAEGIADGREYTDAIDWGIIVNDPIERTFSFDYQLGEVTIDADFLFSYKIALNKSLAFDYAIVREFASAHTFDYKIALGSSFSFDYSIRQFTDFTFDYATIRAFQSVFTFSYKIALNKSFTFDYRTPLVASFDFDYKILSLFGTSFTFSYQIEFGKSFNFDYRYLVGTTFDFSYQIIRSAVANVGYYIERLPETPIVERWQYATRVTTSVNGKEQRASQRARPRVGFNHRYLMLDGDDFRSFQNSLLEYRKQDIRVAQHSLAVAVKSADFGDNDVYVNMDATDIRVGDVVAFFNIGSEQSYLRIVDAVAADHFTIAEGYPFVDGRGIFVMPTRLMRFTTGNGLSMRTVYGEAQFVFEDAQSRDLQRPGVAGGLVASFDGYPIITQRPLANDAVNDAYDAGLQVLDLAGRLAVKVRRPLPVSHVAKSRTWQIRRGEPLDYWREFADLTRGSWRAFLIPSFRPDLVTIEFAGNVLKVAGNKLEDLFALGNYKRLMITTNSGVGFHVITGIVIDGDNTTLTLGTAISGSSIEEISFVNLVRISDDTLTFEHFDLFSELTLNMRVIQQ